MYLPKNYVYIKTKLKLMTQNKFGLNWQNVLKIESQVLNIIQDKL